MHSSLMNKRIAKNRMVNINQVPVNPLDPAMVLGKKSVKFIEVVIKLPIYDSGNPEEWINFVELVSKLLDG